MHVFYLSLNGIEFVEWSWDFKFSQLILFSEKRVDQLDEQPQPESHRVAVHYTHVQ